MATTAEMVPVKAPKQMATGTRAKELAKCERIIAKNLPAFLEFGEAFIRIERDELWKATEKDDSFYGYCERRWDFKKSMVRYQMKAVEVTEDLATMVNGQGEPVAMPGNERQCRVLAVMKTADERRQAWREVLEKYPDAADRTASRIEELLHTEKKEPEMRAVVRGQLKRWADKWSADHDELRNLLHEAADELITDPFEG